MMPQLVRRQFLKFHSPSHECLRTISMISRLWKRKSPENLGNIRRDLERENRNTQHSSKSKTIKKEQSTISNINSCTLNAPKNILTPWLRMKPDSRLADPEIRVERGAFNREPVIIDERGNAIFWVRSPFVRGSVQRLNMVTRQIIGLQIDSAIAQMHFSPRRAALLVGDVLLALRDRIRRHHKFDNDKCAPNGYFVKEATVGRGTYLKRLDIKGRGRSGIQWRGHCMVRICAYRPDSLEITHRLLKIKKIPREDKPIMRRIDYI